jgi:hypothetical protein
MWPEMPWKSIALGAPRVSHEVLRPLLIKIMGSADTSTWSPQTVSAAAEQFFEGRTEFDVDIDVQA